MNRKYPLWSDGVRRPASVIRRVSFEQGIAKVAAGEWKTRESSVLVNGRRETLLDGFQIIATGPSYERNDGTNPR